MKPLPTQLTFAKRCISAMRQKRRPQEEIDTQESIVASLQKLVSLEEVTNEMKGESKQ